VDDLIGRCEMSFGDGSGADTTSTPSFSPRLKRHSFSMRLATVTEPSETWPGIIDAPETPLSGMRKGAVILIARARRQQALAAVADRKIGRSNSRARSSFHGYAQEVDGTIAPEQRRAELHPARMECDLHVFVVCFSAVQSVPLARGQKRA